MAKITLQNAISRIARDAYIMCYNVKDTQLDVLDFMPVLSKWANNPNTYAADMRGRSYNFDYISDYLINRDYNADLCEYDFWHYSALTMAIDARIFAGVPELQPHLFKMRDRVTYY